MARRFQRAWSSWGLRMQVALCCVCVAVTMVRAQGGITGRSYLELSNEYGKTGLVLSPIEPIEETVISLKPGDKFKVYAGALSGKQFRGKLVVGLVRDDTKVVSVFAKREFSAQSVVPMTEIVCNVPQDADIREGDVVRLLTTENDGLSFSKIYPKVGASSGLVTEIPALNYELPLVKINLPMNIPGVTVKKGETALWSDRALKGTNFFFDVIPDDPDNIVVSVVVNGNAVVPTGTSYGIGNVDRDYDIQIKTYDRRQTKAYKVIECTEEVGVAALLTEEELACLKGLKVTGVLREQDFEVFRNQMGSLEILDLLEVDRLLDKDGNAQIYLPENAFLGNGTLREVKIPECVTGLSNQSFRDMTKLEFVVLHSRLCNFGYNEFFNCPALKTVWVKWNPLENGEMYGFPVPPCAFNSTPYRTESTLIVPKGCLTAYSYASKWGDFHKIREEVPVDKLRYEVSFDYYLEADAVKAVERKTGIFAQDGGCRIETEGEVLPVTVYDLSGREVKATTVCGSAFISLVPGFYVVRAGDCSSKVLVR